MHTACTDGVRKGILHTRCALILVCFVDLWRRRLQPCALDGPASWQPQRVVGGTVWTDRYRRCCSAMKAGSSGCAMLTARAPPAPRRASRSRACTYNKPCYIEYMTGSDVGRTPNCVLRPENSIVNGGQLSLSVTPETKEERMLGGTRTWHPDTTERL
jgi:hypothetical protein